MMSDKVVKLLSGVTLRGAEAETYLRGLRMFEQDKIGKTSEEWAWDRLAKLADSDGRDPPWGDVRNPRIKQLMRDVDMLGRMMRAQQEATLEQIQRVNERIDKLWAADPEDQADGFESTKDPHRSPFEYPVPSDVVDELIQILGERPQNEDWRGTMIYRWLVTLKEFHADKNQETAETLWDAHKRLAVTSMLVSLRRHFRKVAEIYKNGPARQDMFQAASIVDKIISGEIKLDS